MRGLLVAECDVKIDISASDKLLEKTEEGRRFMAKKIDSQSSEKCLEREMEGAQWMDRSERQKGMRYAELGKEVPLLGPFLRLVKFFRILEKNY